MCVGQPKLAAKFRWNFELIWSGLETAEGILPPALPFVIVDVPVRKPKTDYRRSDYWSD